MNKITSDILSSFTTTVSEKRLHSESLVWVTFFSRRVSGGSEDNVNNANESIELFASGIDE